VGEFHIEGISTAGLATSMRVPELGVCFDIGACPPSHAASPALLLTHGHPDHVGALVAWVGQRALYGLPPGVVYADAKIAPDVRALLEAGERLARLPFDVQVKEAKPGDMLELSRRNLFARAFRSIHRVPTMGWAVVERRHKLRPELSELAPSELAERRQRGETLTLETDIPLVAYTGDTRIDVLSREPWLGHCRILLLEVTFLDSKKGVERARQGGHIHLDELVHVAGDLRNEHLVAVHLSQGYAPAEARRLIVDRLAPIFPGQLHVFTRDLGARRGD
jgi:ribonuclease Z